VPTMGSGAAALLELPELASLSGTHAVVFRGVGGKEELARQLTARGARVRYAEVYRRVRPAARLTEKQLAGVDIVVTSSREGLDNLYALADGEAGELLRQLPLLVSSAEAARSARAHGQQFSPIISPLVSNERVLEELALWRNRTNRKATHGKTTS
ncbi:MAG: uroporphyrinogen-III synthase, partial [Gammaproteobacteria bacterium]|nr:uroporphyrinogen-III synthase [Gammaproteobacteria bacterium]